MIPTHGISVPPRSRQDIQNITNLLRSKLRIKTPYFPVVDFLEFGLPTIINDFTYEILSVSEMGDNHGATFPERNLIQIREDVYEGALMGKGRDRFTIAHEFGHFFLHSEIPIHARNLTNKRPSITYRDSEWQADCFAGELLMPIELKDNKPSVREIQDLCGVSQDAARFHRNKWGLKE